jgi:hypothetical protein
MMTAPGDAPFAIFCGRLKTPPPIIEPTTRAVSGNKLSLREAEVDASGVTADWEIVIAVLR